MSEANKDIDIGPQEIRDVLHTLSKPSEFKDIQPSSIPNPTLKNALEIVDQLYPGESLDGKNILELLASELTARKHGFEISILSPTAAKIEDLRASMIKELKAWGVSNIGPENSLMQLATAYKQMLEVKTGKTTLPVKVETSTSEGDFISMDEEVSTNDSELMNKVEGERKSVENSETVKLYEVVKKSFIAIKDFLISQGVYDEKRHGHLGSIVDLEKIMRVPISEMTEIGRSYGMSEESAASLPALYAGAIGGQDFDMVLIRTDLPENPEMITHEFMHRTAAKGSQSIGSAELSDQVFIALGFPKEKRIKFKQSPDEQQRKELSEAAKTVIVVNEALNHWATRKAYELLKNKTGESIYNQDDRVYRHNVHAIELLRNDTLIKGRNLSPEQADALILDAAITGDFSKWEQLFGVSILPIVFMSLNDDYLLSRYDEILAKSPEQDENKK